MIGLGRRGSGHRGVSTSCLVFLVGSANVGVRRRTGAHKAAEMMKRRYPLTPDGGRSPESGLGVARGRFSLRASLVSFFDLFRMRRSTSFIKSQLKLHCDNLRMAASIRLSNYPMQCPQDHWEPPASRRGFSFHRWREVRRPRGLLEHVMSFF